MNKQYSIKKPDALIWKSGLSPDQVRAEIASGGNSSNWLVCEAGRADQAVTIDKFDELIAGDRTAFQSTRKQQAPPLHLEEDLQVVPGDYSIASMQQAPSRHVDELAGGEFPALQIIAAIYKVIAVVILVVGVVGIVVLLAAPDANALSVVAAITMTLITPLFLWGGGELILVFLRIEQNTRRANK